MTTDIVRDVRRVLALSQRRTETNPKWRTLGGRCQ